MRIIYLFILVLFGFQMFSATKTFTGPGNFSDPSKWNLGTLPTTGDNLVINGACVFDNSASNLVYGTLRLSTVTTATLSWATGTNTLNVSSISCSTFARYTINMTNGGCLQIRSSWTAGAFGMTFTAGTGMINWNVTTANSTLPSFVTTYNKLNINTSTRTVSTAASVIINSDANIVSGVFAVGGNNFTCSGTLYISGSLTDDAIGGANTLNNVVINSGGNIINTKNETYDISGNFTMLGGAISGSGKPTYNIAGNLLISSGSNDMGNAKVVVTNSTVLTATLVASSTFGSKIINDLLITSSGLFNCSVAEKWTINGNVQVDGTMNANLGVYTLAGTNKTISGTSQMTFDDIKCTGTYTNNATVTMLTSLTGNGTWTQGASGVLNLKNQSANFTVTNFNASASANTVNYAMAGTQAIRIPTDGSYHHLTVSTSGTKTLTANTNVKGNLTITTSTLDVTTSNFSLTVGGNWSNTGLFTPRAALVTFSSTTSQTIQKTGGEIFNNVTFTGSGAKTLLSAITASNVIINSGSNLDVNTTNNQITVKANFTNNGTFNSRSGLVFLNGTTAQTIGGASITDFYDLTLTNSAGAIITNAENLINTLTLNSGTFNTNSKVFTMVSNASNTARIAQIAVGADIVGNVTVQRFAPGGYTGWALLGTPISSGLTLQDWDDDIPISCATCPDGSAAGFLSIYTYDETKTGLFDDAASYIPLSSITDPITPNKGYWVYLGTNSVTTTGITLDVTGTVRKFNNTIPLSRTSTGVPANDGWNLIHNPYPSPIKWSLLKGATTGIDNAIYTYNADLNGGTGGHATYVNGISSPSAASGGIGDNIPMGQAFYVHTTGATALNATESIKVAGNPAFLKSSSTTQVTSSNPLLRIYLDGQSSFHDETVLYLQNGANTTFDEEYDALKLRGQDPSSPIIALDNVANQFQVNGVAPIVSNFSMPLTTTTGYAGTYTISLDNFSSFPKGACINLFDRYSNTTTDLRTNHYVFYLSDTTTVSRFDLNITLNPLTVNSSMNQPSCVFPQAGKIIAQGTNAGPWNYYWKDASNTIVKTSLNKSTADTLDNLSGGDYSLEVNTVGMCDNNESQYSVNTIELPVASFTNQDTVDLSTGGLVVFDNTSTNGSGYNWTFGDGSGFSSDVSPNYNYTTIGTYTITLITTSNSGCTDTTYGSLVVTNIVSGVQELLHANNWQLLTLSNNEYVIQADLEQEELITIKLHDAIGKLAMDLGSSKTSKISIPLDLSNYAPGVYFLNINGEVTKKTVKLLVN